MRWEHYRIAFHLLGPYVKRFLAPDMSRYNKSHQMAHVTRYLRTWRTVSKSVSCEKKFWLAYFFWCENDKNLKACFSVMLLKWLLADILGTPFTIIYLSIGRPLTEWYLNWCHLSLAMFGCGPIGWAQNSNQFTNTAHSHEMFMNLFCKTGLIKLQVMPN